MKKIAITSGATLLPSAAVAHPGHAPGGELGLLHVMTDPFHLGVAAIAAALVVLSWKSMQRWRTSRAASR